MWLRLTSVFWRLGRMSISLWTPSQCALSTAKSSRCETHPRTPTGAQRGAGRERGTSARTVYLLSGGRPQPVQIKTGISDGIVTEVMEGLKEGDRVITAELASKSSAASPAANPFSGGP